MNRASVVLAGTALAYAFVSACGDVVSQPIGAAPGADAGVSDAPVHADGGADASDAAGDAPDFCALTGPIAVPGTSLCLGDLGNVFRFAACACDSLEVSGILQVDRAPVAGDAGATSGDVASIAANGFVATNAESTILGSVWAGGSGTQGAPAVTLRHFGYVAHDVQSGGPIEIGGTYSVGGDVWANGNVMIDADAGLSVQGTVHVPTGDTATGVQGTVVNGPVQVGAPCNCAQPLNIGAIVDAFKGHDDDAAAGLTESSTLAGPVTLPCGRYYVAAIAGANVTLQVNGRVALLVEGDVNVTQALTVQLAPGAELDLVVKGDFSVMGSLAIGDADQPARTRLYLGGTTLSLSATAKPLAADVYAPNATLELSSDLEMWGALFAKSILLSGAFTLHYDPSALSVPPSGSCPSAGGSCTTCDQCPASAPACKQGTCSPCVTDADCCAPLVCAPGGSCVLATQ